VTRMAYTGIDFSDLKNSIYYQKVRGEQTGFELRRFTDPGNWSNPGGIPSNIGPDGLVNGQQPYLARMPREQATAVRAIRDKLAQSRLGRQLLIIADQGHVQFGFKAAGKGEYEAAYYSGYRQVAFNTDAQLFETKSARDFIARASLFGAHELGHVLQDYTFGEGDGFMQLDTTTSLQDRMLAVRHMEAAAVACSIQVAWDVRQAGDDSLWSIALKTPGETSAALAFGRMANADPAAVADGRARRAAHDSWFNNHGRMAAYDEASVERFKRELETLAAQQAAGFPDPDARIVAASAGRMMIGSSAMMDYASMPDGTEHMRLPGGKDIWDEHYCALPNQRIAAQMAHLQKVAKKFRENEPVTQADFDRYDQIGAMFEGTKDAKPRLQQDDNGHPVGAVSALGSWRSKREGAAPKPVARLQM